MTWGTGKPYSCTESRIAGTRIASSTTIAWAPPEKVVARIPPRSEVRSTRTSTAIAAVPCDRCSTDAATLPAIAIAAASSGSVAAMSTIAATIRTSGLPKRTAR